MIAAFLVETGFATYELNQRHRSFHRGRINLYHNYRSWSDLDHRIDFERTNLMERVENLRTRHAEDLSLSRFDQEEEAADETNENEPPISPRVVDFFLDTIDHPRAEIDYGILYPTLQKRGLLKTKDSGQLSQRSKEVFLKELL